MALDMFHQGNILDKQIFNANTAITSAQAWDTWEKPRGCQMVMICGTGAGGAGGNSVAGAASTAAGGRSVGGFICW